MGGRGWDLVAMAKAIHRTEAQGWHESRRSRRSLRGWRSRRDETRAIRGAGEEAQLPAHPPEVGRWSTRSRRRANGVRRGMRVSPTDPVPPAETPSNTSATVVRSTAVKQGRFGRLDLACKVLSNGFAGQAHSAPGEPKRLGEVAMRKLGWMVLVVLVTTVLGLALFGVSALADQAGPGPGAPVADQVGPGV